MDYLTFWATFIVLFALIYFFDKYYFMLRDNSTALPRPYSFSRVQLAWWSGVILASFISILILKGSIPTFNSSILYLLGISSATTVGATLIDISDETNPNLTGLSQNVRGDNLFLDILSDKNGVNVHRFQTVIFNAVFGVYFIIYVINNLKAGTDADSVMPVISSNNLILLGVSSGLYTALKTTENKQPTLSPAVVQPAQAVVNPVIIQPIEPVTVTDSNGQ